MYRFFLRPVAAVLFFAGSVLMLPANVHGAGEFSSAYSVVYDVAETGVTHVAQTITVTNRISRLFAREYAVTIQSDKIDNITATHGNRRLPVATTTHAGRLTAVVKLAQSQVGSGGSTTFVLAYDAGDIAVRNGSVWEVIIPGLQDTTDIQRYTVWLRTPDSFGTAAYMVPEPIDGRWELADMRSGGIRAAFADQQHFRLRLSYFLENQTNVRQRQSITIPPDTAYQSVQIHSLEPHPETIEVDADGNWLAWYTLPADGQVDVQLAAEVTTQFQPQRGRQTVLDAAQQQAYLQPQQYWEFNDPAVAQAARGLHTPEQIYQRVVDLLGYDHSRLTGTIERTGALGAIDNPASSICMEFTDLFVALARANGIPARMVQGYAHTNDRTLRPLSLVRDVLHAWPEYYDAARNLWIPVDPTWGNTTGGNDYFATWDLNHITFARLGARSNQPFPAGSFRKSTRGKDVFVTALEQPTAPSEPGLDISFDLSKQVVTGLGKRGEIVLRNNSSVAYYGTAQVLGAHAPSLVGDTRIVIPPLGNMQIPVKLTSFWWPQDTTVRVITDAGEAAHEISVRPAAQMLTVWHLRFFAVGLALYLLIRFTTYRHDKST